MLRARPEVDEGGGVGTPITTTATTKEIHIRFVAPHEV